MTQYTRVASWRWHLVDAPSPGAKRTGSIRLLLGPWMTNVCISFFLRKHVAQGLVFVWWVVVQKKSQGSEIKDEWIPNFSGKLEGSCSNNTTMLDTFQGNQHNVTTGWYHLHKNFTMVWFNMQNPRGALFSLDVFWEFSLISNSNSIQSISWKVWSDFSFAYVSFHSPNKIISLNRGFSSKQLEQAERPQHLAMAGFSLASQWCKVSETLWLLLPSKLQRYLYKVGLRKTHRGVSVGKTLMFENPRNQ